MIGYRDIAALMELPVAACTRQGTEVTGADNEDERDRSNTHHTKDGVRARWTAADVRSWLRCRDFPVCADRSRATSLIAA